MKKVKNAAASQKDRIICVTGTGEHKLYYQVLGSKQRIDLFEKEQIPFSGSIWAYFRDKGRCLDEMGFSLTLKELYADRKSYHNPKIAKLFERLPGRIDAVLRENTAQKVQVKTNKFKNANRDVHDDRELVA